MVRGFCDVCFLRAFLYVEPRLGPARVLLEHLSFEVTSMYPERSAGKKVAQPTLEDMFSSKQSTCDTFCLLAKLR